jgi:hypothetical protein
MPGYWFMHNMYALARNARKYISRDQRADKSQILEYDFLAPDSVNEMLDSLVILQKATARAWALKNKKTIADNDLAKRGASLLESNTEDISGLEILAEGFENSKRKVQLVKVKEAYAVFQELIRYYATMQLIELIQKKKISNWQQLQKSLPAIAENNNWVNIGGQLIPAVNVQTLVKNIRSGKTGSWDEVHDFYLKKSKSYSSDKVQHAFTALLQLLNISPAKFTRKLFLDLIQQAINTREWMTIGIYTSRAKDYSNAFRQMVYETQAEMEKVTGKLRDNPFIVQQQEESIAFIQQATALLQQFK